MQEAKNRFSQVVNDALSEGPQWVTRHGKRAVVVLAAKDYADLRSDAESSWLDWMRSCPGDELSELLAKREQEEVGSLNLE